MAEPTEAAKTRLPDPTKYIQTSKKHYTIPESEAVAFIHWFDPQFDVLPDKIEGYYWYCDECYIGEVTGPTGGNIRGKFNQRRSMEKHHRQVHQNVWKPILPEWDRSVALKNVDVEDIENHGADAIGTLRPRLFSGEFGTGDSDDKVAPATTVTRRRAGVHLDFADVNQTKVLKWKK